MCTKKELWSRQRPLMRKMFSCAMPLFQVEAQSETTTGEAQQGTFAPRSWRWVIGNPKSHTTRPRSQRYGQTAAAWWYRWIYRAVDGKIPAMNAIARYDEADAWTRHACESTHTNACPRLSGATQILSGFQPAEAWKHSDGIAGRNGAWISV